MVPSLHATGYVGRELAPAPVGGIGTLGILGTGVGLLGVLGVGVRSADEPVQISVPLGHWS